MAVSREVFKQVFTDIGCHEAPPLVDRGKRLLHRMGMKSLKLAKFDVYDAVELVEWKGAIDIHIEQRMLVPMQRRYAALAALDELGINEYDRYAQTDRNGKQWIQLTLSSDPEFRAYAARRRFLDSTYEEDPPIVEVNAADLHLAVTGMLLETDKQ